MWWRAAPAAIPPVSSGASTIEAELVRRVHPPLNVHGVDPEHIQPAVVAAKYSYDTSSQPAEPLQTP